jgi:hypothetical protein
MEAYPGRKGNQTEQHQAVAWGLIAFSKEGEKRKMLKLGVPSDKDRATALCKRVMKDI